MDSKIEAINKVGLRMDLVTIYRRPDGMGTILPFGSTHYRVTLHGKDEKTQTPSELVTYFSTGPGITSEPTLPEAIEAMLYDSDFGEMDFQDFFDVLGGSEAKALYTWNMCKALPDKLATLLSPGQWRRVRDILGVE